MELRRSENRFDETEIVPHMLCSSSNSSSSSNLRESNKNKVNPLNSLVKQVQGSAKSLAIHVSGRASFLQENKFDSLRPLLYLNEDQSYVFVYMFCPNVTQGSNYKKWSLVNIWNKAKFKYILPWNTIFNSCPHTLFNQTITFGSYNGLG